MERACAAAPADAQQLKGRVGRGEAVPAHAAEDGGPEAAGRGYAGGFVLRVEGTGLRCAVKDLVAAAYSAAPACSCALASERADCEEQRQSSQKYQSSQHISCGFVAWPGTLDSPKTGT